MLAYSALLTLGARAEFAVVAAADGDDAAVSRRVAAAAWRSSRGGWWRHFMADARFGFMR